MFTELRETNIPVKILGWHVPLRANPASSQRTRVAISIGSDEEFPFEIDEHCEVISVSTSGKASQRIEPYSYKLVAAVQGSMEITVDDPSIIHRLLRPVTLVFSRTTGPWTVKGRGQRKSTVRNQSMCLSMSAGVFL